MLRNVKRLLIGNPLPSQRAKHERLILPLALAVLASDALSSVAYGPEQILLILTQGNQDALFLILPVALAIAALIWVVIFSYRQLLLVYPHGGGSYSVAKENLGVFWGFLAGAALSLDYVLTVAVSLAAGAAAIYSAWPDLHVNRVEVTLVILLFMALMNLRGIRESGWTFGSPTYLFIGSMFILLGVGFWKLISGVAPASIPDVLAVTHSLDWFLILKAFSSGATTVTGIEAISNGVNIFRDPSQQNARKSLLWLGILLSTMLLGMVYLTQHVGLHPAHNETLLSQLGHWALGGSPFYYLLQLSTFLVLFLAANAAFSGFPQLAAVVAKDGYLPRQFRNRGDRLVYSNGIVGLAFLAGVLIYLFGAETDRLIPLYAIGVFTAFTLSQLGMAVYHNRHRESGWRTRAALGVVGGLLTGIVAIIFAVTKFTEGAWIVVILIPLMMLIPYTVHAHYSATARQLSLKGERNLPRKQPVVAVVPVNAIHRGTLKAIRYAESISPEVHVVHIGIDAEETLRMKENLERWCPDVKLEVLPSPYHSFLQVFNEYVESLQKIHPNVFLTVVVPEFVPRRPIQQLLHNQTALLLKLQLYGKEGVIVVNVPYHLKV
jgi:amino acid transporter